MPASAGKFHESANALTGVMSPLRVMCRFLPYAAGFGLATEHEMHAGLKLFDTQGACAGRSAVCEAKEGSVLGEEELLQGRLAALHRHRARQHCRAHQEERASGRLQPRVQRRHRVHPRCVTSSHNVTAIAPACTCTKAPPLATSLTLSLLRHKRAQCHTDTPACTCTKEGNSVQLGASAAESGTDQHVTMQQAVSL